MDGKDERLETEVNKHNAFAMRIEANLSQHCNNRTAGSALKFKDIRIPKWGHRLDPMTNCERR